MLKLSNKLHKVISKARDSTTTRSHRSHNRETTRALYSNLHEQLDRFFAPRCYDSRIYVKNFLLLVNSYNTYMIQKYVRNVSTLYIGLLQVLTTIASA